VKATLLILIVIPFIALLGCASPVVTPTPESTSEEVPIIPTPTPTPEPSPEPKPTELPPTYNLTIHVEPEGAGSVTQKDADQGISFAEIVGLPIEKPQDNLQRYNLMANPSRGYVFDHWSGDKSGTDSRITITMDSDKTVIAHFVDISTVCLDLDTAYITKHGLTIIVLSISIKEYAEYDECRIRYTLENNTGKPHSEGSFKLWFKEPTGTPDYGYPQTGLFSSLKPGQSVTRSYTWSVSKRLTAFLIEFEGAPLNIAPERDTLKWLVPEYK
jgi:uncharacterized repeat protein (TIGR02543 family)